MIKGNWIIGGENLKDAIGIRDAVFSEEMGLSGFSEDENDAYAMHCVLHDDDAPAAYSRIYFDGDRFRLDDICVKREFRGMQIGDMLARVTILRALEYTDKLTIHCFESSAGFFERFGFMPNGQRDFIGKYPAVWLYAQGDGLKLAGKCAECHGCGGCGEH